MCKQMYKRTHHFLQMLADLHKCTFYRGKKHCSKSYTWQKNLNCVIYAYLCEFPFACLCVTSVINCMPGINRAKFGWITRFVSTLAAAIKPQPSERCQLSLLFPTIFLGCPLLRHVCIRFPATNQSNKNPSLFSSASSFFLLFVLTLLTKLRRDSERQLFLFRNSQITFTQVHPANLTYSMKTQLLAIKKC